MRFNVVDLFGFRKYNIPLVIPARMLVLLLAALVFSGAMSGLLAWQQYKHEQRYAEQCRAAVMRTLERE